MRKELVDKRRPNEKHFLNDDGTIEAIIYSDDVHYLKNGNYQEIDNTLIRKGERYTNKKNNYNVYFSDETNDSLFELEKENKRIKFNLEGINKTISDKHIYSKYKLNLNNKIDYYDIYDGIDLKYQVLANKIKEYLVINDKNSIRNKIVFNLETDLDYKFINKSILFYKDDITYFKIEAPYMIDSNNIINNNIYYEIENIDNKYHLILNLDIDWLNDEARVYPITIDPTITTKTTVGLQDTFISSKYPDTNFNDRDYLLAGAFDNGNDIFRTLIKFGLPTIGTGSSIIRADLYLTGYPYDFYYNTLTYNTMIVNQVTSNWDEATATWNTMHDKYNERIEDFYGLGGTIFNVNPDYPFGNSTFNITNIVKKWYDSGPNYGLLIRSYNDEYISNKYYGKYFSKDNNVQNVNPKPILAITYRNQNGLESYMTYQQKALSNGTIYLNNYNGNMVTSFNLANTIGGLLPVSLNLFYNTNDVILNHDYGFGIGMKLNFHQTVKLVTIEEENMYEYIDEDGTIHYFRKKEETDMNYIDEDGLSLTLEVNENDCNIKDKDKNTMNFIKINDKYYLNSIVDTKGNTISITYIDNKITKIIDASGNEINITYGNDIVITGVKTTTLSLNDNKLISISNYLGTTYINYDNHNIISEIIDVNNLKTKFEYYDVIPYRIKKMSEYSVNDSLGKYLEFNYGFQLTTIKNEKNKIISYSFNNYGNTIGISDLEENENINSGYGNMYAYSYDNTSRNKYFGSSQMIKYIDNLIYNSSFEKDILYFNTDDTLNISFSEDEHLNGKRSLKLNNLGTAYMNVDVLNNKYYTFSCYTKSNIDFKLKLETLNETKEINVLANNSFERNEITIYNSGISTNLKIYFILENSGTVYIDDIQLEEGKIANYYNLIDNSSFEHGIAGWNIDNHQYELGESILDNGLIHNDEIITLDNGKKALKIFCYPSKNRTIEKNFENVGEALDSYYISFWYKNEGVQIDENQNMYKSNQIYGRFFYTDEHGGNDVMGETILNPSNDEWQFASNYLVTPYDYQNFELLLTSISNANYLYVTNFTLVKGVKKGSINYDSSGNIISTHDKSLNETKFKYDNNNQLIKMTNPLGNDFNFEYDNSITNRILKGISPTGITNEIKYDNYGNPVVTRISNITETNLTNGTYCIRKKGTDLYLKVDSNSKKLILDDNTCSHQKWLTEMTDNTIKIKSIFFSPSYIDYSTVLDDISFLFIKQDNDSYLLKTNDKYLTYKDNEFILDSEEDLNNQQFYFEKEDTYYIENEAIYSSDGKFLTKTIDTLFNTTTYDIDNTTGLINNITDPLDNVTNYTYNSKDQLTKITKDDMEVDYTYNNNLLTSIKTNLREYLFNYDEFLNVKSIYIGNSKLIENNYENNNGNLLSSTYGNNDLISYEYDEFNRVSKVIKMNDTYEYYYDNFGNLKRIDSNDNIYFYYYDLAQRINEYKENNFKIKYDYNELNNLISKIQTLNNIEYQYDFEYNSEDNISKITNDDTIINYTYDELGRLISKDINNNINTYSYVNNGKRTSTLVDTYNNSLNTYKYKYDKLGNIIRVYKDNNLINKYYYDSYNELIKEESNNVIEYTYDLYGNILSKKISDLENNLITNNTYQYNNSWVDQLTKYNDIDITYDTIGNPLTIGNITLDWINGRQLNSYSDLNNNITYKYNKEGIRTEKNVNNVIIKYYLEGNKIIFCQNDENMLYFIYENDNLAGFKYNDNKYYYIKNIQEDIIGIMDNNLEQVVSYEYDSWGNILSIKDNNNNDVSNDLTHIANINPFRYRSYYYDIETKLYYLNSRYYNPEWGRFINLDNMIVQSKTNLLGNNCYIYTYNNFINLADLNGHGIFSKLINGLGKAAKKIISTATKIYNAGKTVVRTIVDTASKIAGSLGLTNASTMLSHSLQDNPSNLSYNNNSSIANDIKNSSEFQSTISSVIESNPSGKFDDAVYYLAFNTTDLNLAIYHSKMTINGDLTDGSGNLLIKITDTYDFANKNYSTKSIEQGLISLINNIAYFNQQIGFINNYDIVIQFDYCVNCN